MIEAGKINNVIRIPTSINGNFFRMWVEFLTPLHGLTSKEKDVAAAFIKNRFELSSRIIDDNLLDEYLLSNDIRNKIKTECGVTDGFFQVILGKLRKTNVIVNNKINPLLIPKNIGKDDTSFQLLLYFDFNGKNNK